MKYKYYKVLEYIPDGKEEVKKRLIYTFNNEMAAHDMVEFILKNDFMEPYIGVEEYEVTN